MKLVPLNIARALIAFIVMAAGLIGFGATAPSAYAASYHASCYQTSCHEPAGSEIYLSLDCTYCTGPTGNPPEAYITYIVRAQSSSAVLTSLSVKTTAGSFSKSSSSLRGCNYDNTCRFKFKGNPNTADLYGSNGTTSSPKPAPKPSPTRTHRATAAPTHKATYSPRPIVKTATSPKALPKPVLKPSIKPSPKLVATTPPAVVAPTLTPEATPSVEPTQIAIEPSSKKTGEDNSLAIAGLATAGIIALGGAGFVLRGRFRR